MAFLLAKALGTSLLSQHMLPGIQVSATSNLSGVFLEEPQLWFKLYTL